MDKDWKFTKDGDFPKNGEEVIVTVDMNNHKFVTAAYYFKHNRFYKWKVAINIGLTCDCENVKCWKRLPKPYEESKNYEN